MCTSPQDNFIVDLILSREAFLIETLDQSSAAGLLS